MSELPHIYVIHLPRRTNRYEQFQSAWTSAGLPASNIHLHWFDAVEGVKLPTAAFTGFHTVARTHKARAGRLGAYLSHTGAIAAAIAANHFPLLILEDDAVPTDAQTTATLRHLFDSAPPSANLLYFGALPVKDRKADKEFCIRRSTVKRTRERKTTRKQGREWTPLTATPDVKLYGGHAYGFRTAEAAQHVLTELQKSRITFDSALVRYQKKYPKKVAVLCPFIFHQAEGYSNIEGAVRWRAPSK